MINKKVSTIAGSLIIIAIIVALGFSFFSNKREEVQSQNNVVLNDSELAKEEVEKDNAQKENEENNDLEISDKWTLVNHENFWNNPNLFAHENYNFPNMEFSYPENWEFGCCNDMSHASTHIIYSSKYHDTSLPYIRITDYVLGGCPDSKKTCALDKNVKLTADEKFNRLKSNISKDQILPEKEIEKLNTKVFVFKKTEKEGNFSIAYLINLKNDVIQIDFVNYELLDENFINDFLSRISFESNFNISEEKTIMEDISFCGKLYKSEKVIINNINIAESVAKIANEKNLMCKILEMGKFQESGIGIFQKKEESKNNSYLIVFFHPDNQKEKDDPLNQSPRIFRFDFDNGKIYFQSQFDAKFNYIGDIK